MTNPEPPRIRICAHCQGSTRGYGNVNGKPLCHPDTGLDCYHLVTVYKHPMPCTACASTGTTRYDWRDGNGESTPISRFMGAEIEKLYDGEDDRG